MHCIAMKRLVNGMGGLCRSSPHPTLAMCTLGRPGTRSAYTWKRKPPLTKVVATIGPVSEDAETLQKVVDEGMRVMRVNFSHATYDEANLRLTNLRASKGKNNAALGGNVNNLRAFLLDTQGPEIRTGNLVGGTPIELIAGSTIELTTDEGAKEGGTSSRLFVNYKGLDKTLKVGSTVLLDDGLISLTVKGIASGAVSCHVKNSGVLKNRRGVNLPGAVVDLPALSEKDKTDIRYGVKNDVDFVAASFVRKPTDVEDIRGFIEGEHARVWPSDHPSPRIISKIENMEAVDNFTAILELSDGIMVARGDLGVEVPAEQVTNMQKMMVRECNRVGKPVIVATQMLESMQTNPRPTRAEVSDVTNAVYDGTDAVMLSGESAQGKYPVESVFMMRRIIDEAESWKGVNQELVLPSVKVVASESSEYETIASSAVHAANTLGAKVVVVLTEDGVLARLVSKYRPRVPVICCCPTQKVGRQLIINRGLHPVVLGQAGDITEGPKQALHLAASVGFCRPGDTVILVYKDRETPSKELTLRICKVD